MGDIQTGLRRRSPRVPAQLVTQMGWTMTDRNQPADRPETMPGGAAPDSGGSPIGDLYGAAPGQGAAAPAAPAGTTDAATAQPHSTIPTVTTGAPATPGTTGAAGSRTTGSASHGTTDTMKEEAEHVRESAMDAGRHVADTAKTEARHVAGEAKQQARQLLDQGMHEMREQAKTQQHRAADGMHTFGDDLRGMADGAQSGLAAQLVSEVGERASAAARWLDEREPADLLDEVKSFARRRPATIIAIAGVAGLLVGRRARGIVSEAKEERERGAGQTPGGGQSARSGRAVGTGVPTTASGASATPVAVGSPYPEAAAGQPGQPEEPGGSTRGVTVDADVPAQTGHSPHGTGIPTGRREAGL